MITTAAAHDWTGVVVTVALAAFVVCELIVACKWITRRSHDSGG